MSRARLTLQDEVVIDRMCLEFESAFRAGERPEVETFLGRAPQALREALEDELMPLDAELRASVLPATVLEGTAHAPERIGRYEITKRLGEGGMGTVYEALQDHPRRKVALKVVRADLAGPRLAKRFRREVGVLAHLHHPGIAQIFEAGTARDASGSSELPFLVMEYVPGEPLLDHARSKGLSVRERVALVVSVAHAVQHAHDQGVIHRDLKPANIVVRPGGSSANDGSRPSGDRPVVLDFGLARATGLDLVMSLDTQVGQIVGTLSHMSPEQVSGIEDGVDERSDVYSLGVVLYELLSGRLPHNLGGQTLPEAVESIRSDEPARLGAIDPGLKGDLEIIAGKALEKAKERRYATAAALGADLQRCLDDEPIRARPPSAVYQLRKFARRNPLLVGGLGTAAALLIVALGLVSFYAVREGELRDEAELERDKVAAVAEFQRRLFGGANLEDGGRPRETTLYEVLDTASREVETAFEDAPAVEAAIRMSLGHAYLSMSEIEPAERHFERAYGLLRAELGDLHEDTHAALRGYARSVEFDQRLDEAETLHRRAVRQARQIFGDEHPKTLSSLNNLATTLEDLGDNEGAIETHRRVLALREALDGMDSASVANSLNNLASALELVSELSEAESMFRRALAIREELFEAPHKLLANSLNNLGVNMLRQGRLDDAEAPLMRALEMRERLFGPDHADVGTTLNNLAVLANLRGDIESAVERMRRSLTIQEAQYGKGHPQALVARTNVVVLLQRLGRTAQAYKMQAENVEILRETLGDEHEKTLRAVDVLSQAAVEDGRIVEARRIAEANLADARRLFGVHEVTALALESLADIDWKDGRREEAMGALREARELYEGVTENVPKSLLVRCKLAEMLRATGPGSDWLDEARSIHAACQETMGPDHAYTRRAAALLE